MTLYSLAINGTEIVRVEVEQSLRLPVKPRISRLWLRSVVARALHSYFHRPVAGS